MLSGDALIAYSSFGHKAVLFEPAIEHNGTAEQKAKWLPLARSSKIFGTYAQTELGHGSFVRGIETTATFKQDTDEFVIHSPTISSTKFWPAGSEDVRGQGTDARSIYNEADNSFAPFDHVRVPRSHMLMAHSQLSRNGTFTKVSLRTKLSYSVMLLARGKIPGVLTVQLAQALTIATRSSTVREQGLGPANALKGEASIAQ
jgi:acyl-CoA oxidase